MTIGVDLIDHRVHGVISSFSSVSEGCVLAGGEGGSGRSAGEMWDVRTDEMATSYDG
jgi:hypothetical protein